MKYIDYLFEVVGEDSPWCGEEFLVEVCIDNVPEEDPHSIAWEIATENFPDEELTCHGSMPLWYAETLGLDTY